MGHTEAGHWASSMHSKVKFTLSCLCPVGPAVIFPSQMDREKGKGRQGRGQCGITQDGVMKGHQRQKLLVHNAWHPSSERWELYSQG